MSIGRDMKFDPELHHRRSIRLPGYDYRQPGAYFITLCVNDRAPLFGRINNETMILSDYELVVDTHWRRIPQHNKRISCPTWVVMPNHFHAILTILEAPEMLTDSSAGSLGPIVGNFKSITTRKINQMRHSHNTKVWQRNYYEHIIRDENEYNRIAYYIETNPALWEKDFYYQS